MPTTAKSDRMNDTGLPGMILANRSTQARFIGPDSLTATNATRTQIVREQATAIGAGTSRGTTITYKPDRIADDDSTQARTDLTDLPP